MNKVLWRALGRNTIISIILFGALLGLLYVAEILFPSLQGQLIQFGDPSWVVGIPASVIGVAYILTVRDPQNYTGFYAGILMSILLGVQFVLRGKGSADSAFLFFFVFIPFQMMSIYKWSRSKDDGGASFEPKFLDTPRLLMSIAMLIIITAGDYLMATYILQENGLTENMVPKLLSGLLISSSFLANYWLIYRKTDSWIYWLLYSLAGIGLFVLIRNPFSIVLFTFFLVINSMAGIAWIKATKPENLNWAKIFVKK
ncbi:MAG: nicotinamide mononucleotide transporter [Paludibacteraceae bacterium]|nr:nicotinamide mononucleotide transporter [Paludibacteraceae bacterium]MBQ4018241.1 nicotinamide mononucleotide transporter [Paludibacteraceae bacterium]MBQ5378670.1 nicotinamide mononucleotide transporter [Paludibacteraceae bacterium]